MRFFLNDVFFVDTGIFFRNYNLDLNDININITGYLLDVNLGFHFVSSNFLGSMVISPGFRSDFESIDSKHYNLDFLCRGAYKMSDPLALVAGFKLYQRGTRWEIIPVGGINFHYKYLYANILMPFDAEIGLNITKKYTLFVKYEGVINDQFATEIFNNTADDNFRITYYSASGGIRFKLIDNVVLFATAGYNFQTKLDGDGDNASLNAESDNGTFEVEFGIDIDLNFNDIPRNASRIVPLPLELQNNSDF